MERSTRMARSVPLEWFSSVKKGESRSSCSDSDTNLTSLPRSCLGRIVGYLDYGTYYSLLLTCKTFSSFRNMSFMNNSVVLQRGIFLLNRCISCSAVKRMFYGNHDFNFLTNVSDVLEWSDGTQGKSKNVKNTKQRCTGYLVEDVKKIEAKLKPLVKELKKVVVFLHSHKDSDRLERLKFCFEQVKGFHGRLNECRMSNIEDHLLRLLLMRVKFSGVWGEWSRDAIDCTIPFKLVGPRTLKFGFKVSTEDLDSECSLKLKFDIPTLDIHVDLCFEDGDSYKAWSDLKPVTTEIQKCIAADFKDNKKLFSDWDPSVNVDRSSPKITGAFVAMFFITVADMNSDFHFYFMQLESECLIEAKRNPNAKFYPGHYCGDYLEFDEFEY